MSVQKIQHIHILGICGTFMGSLAQLALAKGLRVTGCDTCVYPPMSTQLKQAGIDIVEGYDPEQLALEPDLILIGNAMSRGNPLVEAVLDRGLPYMSGPQWLHDVVLPNKWVLAVSGTHGKTTTSSLLTCILDYAGLEPGYLIGGVPGNFGISARLGDSAFFVIEADEYDTAFFDKRSKFIHYQPRTLIINNLEFDHADIFDDLQAIQAQFHHLVRVVPSLGLVIHPEANHAVDSVIDRGCWTPTETFSPAISSTGWSAEQLSVDDFSFKVFYQGDYQATVNWAEIGRHNIANAMAAIAAAHHVGVQPQTAVEALASFKGVKRRMECIATLSGISIYDDFAHHPTAIRTTLEGLRAKVRNETIIAMIEPRSNTMRMGVHQAALGDACGAADYTLWYSPPELDWSPDAIAAQPGLSMSMCRSIDGLIERCCQYISSRANASGKNHISGAVHVVIMSNGSFSGVHQRLLDYISDCGIKKGFSENGGIL